MKKILSHAFVRRRRAKLAAIIGAAVGLVPYGMPAEMHRWFAEQFPWAPSWTHIALAMGVLAWRVSAGTREARRATRSGA